MNLSLFRFARKPLPIVEYLEAYPGKINSTYLKKRLYAENLLQEQCYECGLGNKWQGKAITLEIDHINGDAADNRLKNLQILCPNCHSQTITYKGRNKSKKPTLRRNTTDF